MDRVLRGVMKQSVSVFSGFVNQTGDNLMNKVRIGLEKAYSDNNVECCMPLTHFSGDGATRVFLQSQGDQ